MRIEATSGKLLVVLVDGTLLSLRSSLRSPSPPPCLTMANEAALVVFPTPPFPLVTATILPYPSTLSGSGNFISPSSALRLEEGLLFAILDFILLRLLEARDAKPFERAERTIGTLRRRRGASISNT